MCEIDRIRYGGTTLIAHAVEVNLVSKRFGPVTVLDRVDLVVPVGETFGLLGANGAGKSTLLSMIATLQLPSSGEIRVFGEDTRTRGEAARRNTGVLFEDISTPRPYWTVREYLAFFASLRRAAALPERLLSLLGVTPLHDRACGTLSNGERRRVEIARALIGDPPLLLFDEPTKELDLLARRAVWSAIREMQSDRRVTIILSSHDAREVGELCDSVTILKRGRVAASIARPEWRAGPPGALEDRLIGAM